MQKLQDNSPGQKNNSEHAGEQNQHVHHQDQQGHDSQATEANAQNAQDKEIAAYFSSLNDAQQAAQRLSSHASQMCVDKVPMQNDCVRTWTRRRKAFRW